MSEPKLEPVSLTVNGKAVALAANPDTALLFVLREQLGDRKSVV